jgi:hypothetical protein
LTLYSEVASDQGLGWVHFSCSQFFIGVLGKRFSEANPFSDFLVCFFFPFFDRCVIQPSIFWINALFLCVELVDLLQEFLAFFSDLLDVVSSMLVVVSIFPKEEEALPHCGYDRCCPSVCIGFLWLGFLVVLLLYLFPFFGDATFVEVGPSDFILFLECRFDDPAGLKQQICICYCFDSLSYCCLDGILRQIKGIGKTLAFSLLLIGISTFDDVLKSSEMRIGEAANRPPPFGADLRKASAKILQCRFKISATIEMANSSITPSRIICTLKHSNHAKETEHTAQSMTLSNMEMRPNSLILLAPTQTGLVALSCAREHLGPGNARSASSFTVWEIAVCLFSPNIGLDGKSREERRPIVVRTRTSWNFKVNIKWRRPLVQSLNHAPRLT